MRSGMFRRSASSAPEEEPAGEAGADTPPATPPGERSGLTGAGAKGPPERPPLPPYPVTDDNPTALDTPGSSGCVVGWGLPYGKPTPDTFELQFGYAIRGKWTVVQPPIASCRRLTVRPVGRPKDGVGERWCVRLNELEPKTKYVVQVRGVNSAGKGEWSKSGSVRFDGPPPAAGTDLEPDPLPPNSPEEPADEAAAATGAGGRLKGFGAKIPTPFGRRSTTSAEGADAAAEPEVPDPGAFVAAPIDYAGPCAPALSFILLLMNLPFFFF